MTVTPQPSLARGFYPGFALYSRRASAVLLNFWLFVSLVTHSWWLRPQISHIFAVAGLGRIPACNLALAVGVFWYAFLSQLKVRWVIALPAYLLFFPSFKVFCIAAKPAVRALQTFFDPATEAAVVRQIPTKRIWLFLFFAWVVAFRGLDLVWAAWILPLLAVPLWLYFLRLAYNTSVAPITFVNLLLQVCTGMLDSYMKSLREAKASAKRDPSSAFVNRVVLSIMRRYSGERVVAVIQREAIAAFSLTLLAAVLASASFWALVARALIKTSIPFEQSYQFFTTGSWFESVLWAFGCMTTTVAMPGAGAPVWVKAIHVLVLLTGIFQFTYLLACFSLMASAEAGRIAREANSLMQQTEAKLQQSRELEIVTLNVATITTKDPSGRS